MNQVIDLGAVASEQRHVQFGVTVKNPYMETRTFKLEPDCSCVRFESDRVAVRRGQAVEINGYLSLYRKLGQFESTVRISDATSAYTNCVELILIKAKVIQSWSALPLRIVIAPNSVQNLRLVAPSNQWDDAVVLSIGNGFRLEQINSKTDQYGNLIKDYSVHSGPLDQLDARNSRVEVRHSVSHSLILATPILIEGIDVITNSKGNDLQKL